MDRIISGRDLARRDGARTQEEWIRKLCKRLGGQLETPFTGKVREDMPVLAEIDWGRWIAKCECGGAEYVDPGEAVFYCFSCGNARLNGDGRLVVFPDGREKIEAAVLEREVEEGIQGANALERVMRARPKEMARNWAPGQTAEDLRGEARAAARRQDTHAHGFGGGDGI